ncbi:hypothetical protein NEDG_00962 [Nematocida displodere]|uniref:Uncharacterized protein n=1 Tax=Nematocida displodere TaxID=1805483 RepID=A0A177EA61_9MICR|nr:hypothetical protein NEDG_00962 [Nematocida displodere]
MGGIISKCINRKKRSVVFIGAAGSGKTSLILGFKGNQETSAGTVTIYEQSLIRGNGYTIDLFDLSGNQDHTQFWKFYTEHSHLVVFIVDISSKESVQQSKDVFEAFYTSYAIQKDNIIFLLNKIDLVPEEARNELVSLFHSEFMSVVGMKKGNTQRVMTTSAGVRSQEVFKFVCKSIDQ